MEREGTWRCRRGVQGDLMAQQALRACGLYKFWCLGILRAKPRLLQMLVDYWDPDSEYFHIDRMSLTIEVEDRYFITIDEYIAVYCFLDMKKVGSQIPTNSIQVLGLKAILLALGRIAELASLHQASRPLTFYAVECMRATVYKWSNALLSNMKQYLSECKMGRVRNFGFSRTLITFFFERVPGLSPRVDIPPHGVQDPAQ